MKKINCQNCKKRIKKPEDITFVIDDNPNEVTVKPLGFLCPKCTLKVQMNKKSGAGVEITQDENGDLKALMVCSHCGIKTEDKQYYLTHNCLSVLGMKNTIESNRSDRNNE